MRNVIAIGTFVLAAVVMMSSASQSADASWFAAKVLESGVPRHCGDKYTDFRMRISGMRFEAVPVDGDSNLALTTRLNIASLRPDGSGSITVTNPKNQAIRFDFEAGTGPRTIRWANEVSSCRFAWVPK